MKALLVVKLRGSMPRFVVFDHETTEETNVLEKRIRRMPEVERVAIVKSHIADELLFISDDSQPVEELLRKELQ